MPLNAFIVRPFGIKNEVDFDKVDELLIQPALRAAGILGSTTASILEAGNIREDMFCQLLTADIVIADVSIHNANVFYELGIRHALRDKRTYLIRCSKDEIPFDLKTDRYLSYDAGNPSACITNLAQGLNETLISDRKDSPVFYMLPKLEPQNAEVFLVVPPDFSEELEVASSCQQAGKLALLAAESDSFEWRIPALRLVGEAQFKIKSLDAARLTWEKIKNYRSDDLDANDRLSSIYQRLADDIIKQQPDEAMELLAQSDNCVKRILKNYTQLDKQKRAEVQALKARNFKSRWINAWKRENNADIIPNALSSLHLKETCEAYERAYGEDLNHIYSGLNALAMITILLSLAAQVPDTWQWMFDTQREADDALQHYKDRQAELATLVKSAIKAEEKRLNTEDAKDVWLEISKADYALLTLTSPHRVQNLYHEIVEESSGFNFESSHRQLKLYKSLNVLPANTGAALDAFGDFRSRKKNNSRTLLFTGHMIDKPDRADPRFPAEKEEEIRAKIKEVVQKEKVENDDKKLLGIAGGACGGDILFHEVCRELGIKTELYLAIPPDQFVIESVAFAGGNWIERFYKLYNSLEHHVLSPTKELPNWLKKRRDYSIWERANLWMLNSSLTCGGANMSLIAVWNGQGGDGPGGAQHMVNEAKNRGSEVNIISI